MSAITCIIANGGDGSHSLRWVTDADVLDRLEELADDGDDVYGGGEGLQKRRLVFPDGFDLGAWMKINHINLLTMRDLE